MLFLVLPSALSGLLVLLLQASLTISIPLSPDTLEKRATPAYCSRPDFVFIDKILSQYANVGSAFCSTFLHIPPPSTVTVTTTGATVTSSAVLTGQATTTVTSGVATTSSKTSTTSTETDTSTTYTSTTTLQISFVTSTVTSRSVGVTVIPPATTTVTSFTANTLLEKRAVATVADIQPKCPPKLCGIAFHLASSACSCFVTTQPDSTVVVTATATATTTINGVSTLTTVEPSATTTQVSTILIATTTATTETDVVVVTGQSTQVQLTTTTTTTTSTSVGPTSTVVIPVVVTYNQVQKKVGYPSCAYNRYYTGVPNVSGDPGPNNDFAVGLRQCQNACTADPRCKFFYYDAYDPAHTNGGFAGGECDLDNQPYDPSLLQCNLPTRFGVGYNKNS